MSLTFRALPPARGWRWAKAKMYRELRAEGKASEARRIFRSDRIAKRVLDAACAKITPEIRAEMALNGTAYFRMQGDGTVERLSAFDLYESKND